MSADARKPILDSWTTAEGHVAYRFILPGCTTKKTSNRIMRFGQRLRVMPSQRWIDWRNQCKAYIATKPELQLALATPVNCAATFYREAKRGDAVGYYTGLADVLEECGVVLNDRLITQWDGSRLRKDPTNPRVEIVLTVLSEHPELTERGDG